jgi:hypothetical protein
MLNLLLRRKHLREPTCLRQNRIGRGNSAGSIRRSGFVQVADVACAISGIPTGDRCRIRATVPSPKLPIDIAGRRERISSLEAHNVKKTLLASVVILGLGTSIAGQALAKDTTPPVVKAVVTGTQGSNGWYTSNVSLTWVVTDAESRSIKTTGCGSVSLATDTSGTTYTCRATSAGGTSTQSVTLKRDATLPGVTLTTPANGATYAVGQAVPANYSCSDAMSRVASCTGSVSSGSLLDTATGGSKSFTVTATDNAGNVKATTVSYTVADTSPPVITPSISGTLGNNGWYTSNVNLTWSVIDAESAFTQSGCGAVSITSDTSTTGTTFICSATSAGGSTSKSVTIKRDATLPTATIATPASGATYTQNQSVTASFACSDAPAGIATCTGTVANGVAINTSSTGTKSFAVTAADQAGNLTTKSVSYSVTSSTTSNSGGTRLFAWNDLGMHCMDTDYSVFTLLPPFNNLNAQLMVNGQLVSSGYTLEYQSASDPTGSTNTSSAGKTNFWEYVSALFGVGTVPANVGLTGNPTASTTPAPLAWNGADKDNYKWFEATGIPITPLDDKGSFNPYPMVKVTAKNSSGQEIASTHAVLPVSTEMNCSICHASSTGSPAAKPTGGWVNSVATPTERDWRLNVLRLHDQKNAGNANYSALLVSKGYGASLESSVTNADPTKNKPIFCDTCHNSNALSYWGLAGEGTVSPMTAAMHNRHAGTMLPGTTQALDSIGTRDACYTCHPGKETKCLRGAMGNPVDALTGKHVMECQSCHGPMVTVGGKRDGWYDMPTCQSCHHDGVRDKVAINANGSFKIWSDKRFASNADTPATGLSMYRFSVGHGNLQCEACHNSTHAEFTTKTAANSVNDNLRAIEAQGYSAAIRECTACHATAPASAKGGPHGMHYLGASWVKDHHDVVTSTNKTDCLYCHGSTSTGSDLAVIKVAKTFNIGDGRTKSFAPEDRVTCWSCHNGPMR